MTIRRSLGSAGRYGLSRPLSLAEILVRELPYSYAHRVGHMPHVEYVGYAVNVDCEDVSLIRQL
jgi:hypothetical protein